jgi:hypothetical protein
MGRQFLFKSANPLPGGNIGTLYPDHGCFYPKRKAWDVWGPNGLAGVFKPLGSAIYCLAGACPGVAGYDATPDEHKLDIWGVTPVFTFDDMGNVFWPGNIKVGVLSAEANTCKVPDGY